MRKIALPLCLSLFFLLLALSPALAEPSPENETSLARYPEIGLAAPDPAAGAIPFASSSPAPRFGISEAYLHEAGEQPAIQWQRLIFSWAAIQPDGPHDWRSDLYFPPELLRRQIDRGHEVVGVLQFTPEWAARNPADGQRSVPSNLSAPANSPENHWAQFAGRMAAQYRGRIDRWVIWNEPEFRPGDTGAGQSFTWLGSDADYYMLLKRGYQAIKAANPEATVVFGGTSYWVDINMGRAPFFTRVLDLIAADPEARDSGYFFDAAAFNIYWCPDDLLRVAVEMKAAMHARGIDRPIWISETNAMPYDDPETPKEANGQRVTLSQQADFAIQALALASAAGYQRIGWYRMNDGGLWGGQEAWGLIRDNGAPRPALAAFRTALSNFSGARRVSFLPLERPDQPFGTPWPIDPVSFYPNWQVYQVVFDHSDGRRASVLWNGTDSPLRVRVPRQGEGAVLVERDGRERAAPSRDGWHVVDLAPATVRGPLDPEGYHYVGGPPVMLLERNVPSGTPLHEPRLGDPGSAQPGLALSLDPAAAKFFPGESASFTLRLRGIEGFGGAVRMSVPVVPDGATIEMPEVAYPGQRVTLTVRSDGSLAPNLYILELAGSADGIYATTDLVLEVPAP